MPEPPRGGRERVHHSVQRPFRHRLLGGATTRSLAARAGSSHHGSTRLRRESSILKHRRQPAKAYHRKHHPFNTSQDSGCKISLEDRSICLPCGSLIICTLLMRRRMQVEKGTQFGPMPYPRFNRYDLNDLKTSGAAILRLFPRKGVLDARNYP